MLTKSERVLTRVKSPLVDPDDVFYAQADEDNPGEYVFAVAMRGAVAEHMGSPDVITVTVEPGDRLNG